MDEQSLINTGKKLQRFLSPYFSIVVAGQSGCGKSTFTEYLADELNCPVICGDVLMYNGLVAQPEQTKSVFGAYPDKSKDGFNFVSEHYKVETPEKERALIDMSINYIDEQVEILSKNLIHSNISFASSPKGKHDENPLIINPQGSPQIIVVYG